MKGKKTVSSEMELNIYLDATDAEVGKEQLRTYESWLNYRTREAFWEYLSDTLSWREFSRVRRAYLHDNRVNDPEIIRILDRLDQGRMRDILCQNPDTVRSDICANLKSIMSTLDSDVPQTLKSDIRLADLYHEFDTEMNMRLGRLARVYGKFLEELHGTVEYFDKCLEDDV